MSVESTAIEPRLGRDPLIPSAVLGMLIFVFSEIMMFSGLISAVTIARAGAAEWPPPGQARLPLEATAFNTLVLLASGIALWWAARVFKEAPSKAYRSLLVSMLLGAFFVCFQGYEWVGLLREGLTLTSSNHGGFFYLIVGAHALHAVAGLTVLSFAFLRLRSRRLTPDFLAATQVFWFFVVGLWPFLYLRIYL
ncbi:MAG: heme-copper oxidase subunit III [bacterium]|nr:heme-copper oxidase subunit III [bacterium]MCP5066800.1 heme-copper oxidase subunit III [bacterium]